MAATAPRCRKDGQETTICPACKGHGATGVAGRLICNTCKNTRHLCPKHGAYWQ